MTENSKNFTIYHDDTVQINLFRGDDPFALGHVVIEPKSEAHDTANLSEKEWKVAAEWISKITKAMKKVLREIVEREVEKIYVCSFNEDMNYTVHFHLVPRYEGDTLKGPELLCRNKAGQVISPVEKQNIVQKLKEELKRQ